jgi:hypothetical protein
MKQTETRGGEFKRSALKHENILAKPEKVYSDKGWKGFHDWLGYETIRKNSFNFLPYNDGKIFVHGLNLSNEKEWREFKRLGTKPENIPAKPEKVYNDKGWKGFKDWLGYETIRKNSFNFLPYNDAKIFVHRLNLSNENAWKDFKRLGTKPENIPAKSETVYKGKGWKGFKDWLGY